MVDIYGLGTSRLIYQSKGFVSGKTVTGRMFKPDLTSEDIVYTEIADGFYYYDFDFTTTGVYSLLVYENGAKKKSNTYRVNTISDDITRILGLVHENMAIDDTVYDVYGNLTSARLRIYSDPASVGSGNDVIGTYQIESVTDDPGKFITWKMRKV